MSAFEKLYAIPTETLRKIADRHLCNPYYEICHQTDSYYDEIENARFVLRMRAEQPDRFPEPVPGMTLIKVEYTHHDGGTGWKYVNATVVPTGPAQLITGETVHLERAIVAQ